MAVSKYQYHPENTTWGKTKAAVVGAPIRVASLIGGIPKGLGETYNAAANFLDTIEHPALQGSTPKIPQSALNYLPNEQSLVNRLKDTPFEETLPTGSLEPHPWIDKPLAFAATAPFMGIGRGANYLAKAASAYPTGLMGEAAHQTGEALHLPEWAKTGLEVGTMLGTGALTNKAINTGKNLFTRTQSTAEKLKERLLNKNLPLYKEASKATREELMEAHKLAREELHYTKLEQANIQKQRQQIAKDLEKYNASTLEEGTRADKELLRKREAQTKLIDKFSHDNQNILSRQDAARLKEKIRNGEQIDIPTEFEANFHQFDKDMLENRTHINDIRTSEEALIDTKGGSKNTLREHAKDLYNQFEESTNPRMMVSDKYIQPIISDLKEKMSRGLGAGGTEAKRRLSTAIKNLESKIKDGYLKVQDVAAIEKDLKQLTREWFRETGQLSSYEKSAYSINKKIKQTLDLAKQEHPTIELEKLRKADRIISEVSTAQEAQEKLKDIAQKNFTGRQLSKLWSKISDTDFMHMFKSSSIRKYYIDALASAARGNTKETIKNLLALDRTLESQASKTARESMPINIPVSKTQVSKGVTKYRGR